MFMPVLTDVEGWAEYLNGFRTYAREGKRDGVSVMEHVETSTGRVLGRVTYHDPRTYEVFVEVE